MTVTLEDLTLGAIISPRGIDKNWEDTQALGFIENPIQLDKWRFSTGGLIYRLVDRSKTPREHDPLLIIEEPTYEEVISGFTGRNQVFMKVLHGERPLWAVSCYIQSGAERFYRAINLISPPSCAIG